MKNAFPKRIFQITVATALGLSSQPVWADVILPGRCHMGECWESKLLRKNVLKKGSNGTLYEIRTASRSWPMDSQPSSNFGEPSVSYVYCSTTKPAYIFKADDTLYAHLLNPGGDYGGIDQSDYPIYWATCHNFVGPDFFSEEMTQRAKKLGYPLDLPSEQIELKDVLDIIN